MRAVAEPVDLLVVGGGINGVGIARDAAGRGLSVLLCEKGDLAGATSSASSKLIHGGLRYLEHFEIRLVREALREREILLAAAPHIIRPLRFVLPHDRALRPAWMLRIGLFLYDHLARRDRLPGSARLDLRHAPEGAPLKDLFRRGFAYSDCWVDDARLVVVNAIDAQARGAQILTRVACTGARRIGKAWEVDLATAEGTGTRRVAARALVNAAGPWVDGVLDRVSSRPKRNSRLRLVKGSHVVVPRLYQGDQAYILQNRDGRVVFVLPFGARFCLIGTTEEDYEGDPRAARINEGETDYLCGAVNHYFARPVSADDVVWSFAGVRPLYDDANLDAAAVTRDYVFDLDTGEDRAPLLSVFGGKITTYRKLAEHALDALAPHLGLSGQSAVGWTQTAVLPGGDLPNGDPEAFRAELQAEKPWLPAELTDRAARAYGTRVMRWLGAAGALDQLGRHFGDQIYEAELDYLCREEWVRDLDDLLWRRTKLGLTVAPDTRERLATWLAAQRTPAAGIGSRPDMPAH